MPARVAAAASAQGCRRLRGGRPQREAAQTRDCQMRLQDRPRDVSAEGHDDRLLLGREGGRGRFNGSAPPIRRVTPYVPFGHSFRVYAISASQGPHAAPTMLDRATDRLSRAGASVYNLQHSASLHSSEKTAPSKPGTKQVASASLSVAIYSRLSAFGQNLSLSTDMGRTWKHGTCWACGLSLGSLSRISASTAFSRAIGPDPGSPRNAAAQLSSPRP